MANIFLPLALSEIIHTYIYVYTHLSKPPAWPCRTRGLFFIYPKENKSSHKMEAGSSSAPTRRRKRGEEEPPSAAAASASSSSALLSESEHDDYDEDENEGDDFSKSGTYGGRWSANEDLQLQKGVDECGPRQWRSISENYLNGKRTDVQCLHRWQKVRTGRHEARPMRRIRFSGGSTPQ